MARWDEILYVALNNIHDVGLRGVTPERVLREGRRVQIDIARRGLAIQSTALVTTIAGTDSYAVPSGNFHIQEIFPPSVWTEPITPIHNTKTWRQIVKDTTVPSDQPLYVTIWNGLLVFYQAPAQVVDILLWLYKLPSVEPSAGADPEVGIEWDNALAYGVTAELLAAKPEVPQGNWLSLYEMEIAKRRHESLKKGIAGPLRVSKSSDRLGF